MRYSRTNKKKIVHITFDMGIAGAERVIYNLVQQTDSTKFDVSILCLDQPIGSFGIKLQTMGCSIIALNRKPGFDFSLAVKIRSIILRDGIDVLHCHQYTPYVYGLLGSLGTKCKVIFTEHGRFHPDRRKFKRVILNPFFNLATDHITAISAATKRALVKFENFPSKKIKVIYNGIDDTNFLLPETNGLKKNIGIPDNSKVLGTVARLDSIKNQKMMIKALKLVHQYFPDTHLVIVGDGPEKDRLIDLASKLELLPYIRLLGFREDAHIFYKIMDIFLLTSFSEGTAMTLLEAMASSIPCVVTDVGGNPEIVINGETGIIVPNNNEQQLADKICDLIKKRDVKDKMGKAGRKRFVENFRVDKMVESYEKIYNGTA